MPPLPGPKASAPAPPAPPPDMPTGDPYLGGHRNPGHQGLWGLDATLDGASVADILLPPPPPPPLEKSISTSLSGFFQEDISKLNFDVQRRYEHDYWDREEDGDIDEPVLLRSMGINCRHGPSGGITALQADAAEVSDSIVLESGDMADELEVTLSADAAVRGAQFKWVRGEVVGRGTMGSVFRALDQETGSIFAAKEVLINQSDDKDNKLRHDLENEINILRHLEHPNIVRYLGHDCIEDSLYVYMEYMPGGSIQAVLCQFGPFEESLIAVYIRALLGGLAYLHTREPPVVHRDIKGANVLVGSNCEVKLSDFGCSKREIETMTNQMRGSIPWMAPEVIKSTGYGRAADMWSFGCVMIEMATARSPWGRFDNPIAALRKIGMGDGLPPVPDSLSPVAKDFISMCVVRDQHERLTATELLEHEFIADLLDPD